jgi:5-methylcytosine-specific restriction endonuclease McrA
MVKQRQTWVRNYSEIAKQRIDNRECPACGKPKSEWTRTTVYMCCSKQCSEKFYGEECAIQDWKEVRKKAFKRDNYTCKYCNKKFTYKSQYDGKEYPESEKLIGDHIIPIAVGGEEFDINNVQTLCIQCNKIKTKRDAQRIAKFRKREKEMKFNIDIMKVEFPKQEELEV